MEGPPPPGPESSLKAYRYHSAEADSRGEKGVYKIENENKFRSLFAVIERIRMNPDALLGRGNNAFVFDATSGKGTTWCVKNLWENLLVASRYKNYAKLPQEVQKMKDVQDYFDLVNEKRNQLIRKGVMFAPQNGAFDEGVILNRASKIANKAGFKGMIPKANHILVFERDDFHILPDGDRYTVSEKVNMILMEKIYGKNIEECVMDPAHCSEILEKVDLPSFEQKLSKLIDLLHENGIYHQDISTRNIIISEDGEPHLIDFGAGQHIGKSEDMYESDKDNLRKSLNWLRKVLKNPQGARDEFTENMIKKG